MFRKIVILLLFTGLTKAQDKLFFINGTTKTGFVVSMGNEIVFFRKNDTSKVEQIKKSELIMIENYKGVRYLFSERDKKEINVGPLADKKVRQNSMRLMPFGLFAGRASVLYERYNAAQNIGLAIPLIVTFDPGRAFLNDSLRPKENSGIGFISGADVNFYFGKKENLKFFAGPRLRFGKDIAFSNIEAITFQSQVGWRLGGQSFIQQFSIGYGFIRIFSFGRVRFPTDQFFSWYSINYSVGFRW